MNRSEATGDDVVGPEPLAAMKLTNREKDYAVVGELARLMGDPRSQLLYSRSSRDLIRLAGEHPGALAEVMARRPLLARIAEGREALEEALDRERRLLMRANQERLARYQAAAEAWAGVWPEVQRQSEGLPLLDTHRLVIARAEGILPFEPPREAGPCPTACSSAIPLSPRPERRSRQAPQRLRRRRGGPERPSCLG